MNAPQTLSFGEIILLKPNLAEVVVSEGMEINIAQVEEFHGFLLTHLRSPFGLLINKKHHYTYSFEAQLKITDLPEIKAIAVLVFRRTSALSTLTLKKLPGRRNANLEIFDDRDIALNWLDQQLLQNL